MPATVIVGLQWVTRAKGKTTDYLAEDCLGRRPLPGRRQTPATRSCSARRSSSSTSCPRVCCTRTSRRHRQWRRVNPATLISELDMLASRGIEVDRVRVSKHAHVIMPYHIALDGAMEARLGEGRRRHHAAGNRGLLTPTAPGGSGSGWRNLLDGPALRGKLARILPEKNATLQRQHRVDGFDLDELVSTWRPNGSPPRTAPGRYDPAGSRAPLPAANISCFEGAQGTLLDLDTAAIRCDFVQPDRRRSFGTGGGIGPLQVTK